MARKRIQKEFLDITKQPVPNFLISKHQQDPYYWNGYLYGLTGTVYENGVFSFTIRFPLDYPFRAPRIAFNTKIFHTNISSAGGVCSTHMCLGIFQRWTPVQHMKTVLQNLKWSIINPQCCDFTDFSQMFLYDRAKWNAKAKEWTQKYAIDPSFKIPSPLNSVTNTTQQLVKQTKQLK